MNYKTKTFLLFSPAVVSCARSRRKLEQKHTAEKTFSWVSQPFPSITTCTGQSSQRISWSITTTTQYASGNMKLPSQSRSQKPRSFWLARGIATSGQVQLRKSAIHGLPVTLRMLRVKSDKSDWFWSQSIVFTQLFKTGMSLGLARGPDISSAWQKGPLGTRLLPSALKRVTERDRVAFCFDLEYDWLDGVQFDNTTSKLNGLKGPSQPLLCFCLHTRIWLLYFSQRMSKRRKSLSNY